MRAGFFWLSGGFAGLTFFLCYGLHPFSAMLFFLAAALAVLAAVLAAKWKKIWPLPVVFLGCCLAAGLFLLHQKPAEGIFQTAETGGRYAAKILDYSQPGRYGHVAKAKLFTQEAPVIMVYLPAGAVLEPGDIIGGDFSFSVPDNEGSFAAERYYRSKGIWLFATVRHVSISKTSPSVSHWPNIARHWAAAQTEALFPAESAVMKALLFGDRQEFDPSFQADVSVTGMAHIFAVSGMHLSFLVSLVLLLGRRRKWLFFPAVLLMFAMMAITGFPPSIVRAGVMQGMALLAVLLGREEDSLATLLLALVVLLAVNPYSAADVGLQFSFLCVFGLITVGKRLSAWLLPLVKPKSKALRKGWEFVVSAVAASASAQLATIPLVVLYFGQVSLVAVLANVLILWCVGFVFLGAAAALCLSAFWFAGGAILAAVVSWGGAYIRLAISLLAKLPLAAVGTGGALFTVWIFFAYALWTPAYGLRIRKAWRLAPLLLATLVIALWTDGAAAKNSAFLWALDMGNGQCIVIRAQGKTVAVDCGSVNFDAAAALQSHLRRQNLSKIDALVLTHLDADHASGAETLLQSGQVGALLMPRYQQNETLHKKLVSAAEKAGTAVFLLTADENFRFGNLRLAVFLPPGGSGGNAGGLAVLAECDGMSALVLGDIDDKSDAYLAKTRDLPKVSVLVAGHHGAKNATSATLLQKILPKYVIISVGASAHDHPAAETLERLSDFGCETRRTDRFGTVLFRFYKNKVFTR